MKIFPRKKDFAGRRAFAVIIVLIAVVVLTIMAAAFAFSMKVETRLAANANNDEQMIWLGRAGMERACWILAMEANQPFDALNQIWAGGPGAGPETNSPLMGISLNGYAVGLPELGSSVGTVDLKIVDLERRINVNSAPPQLLQQVLTSMGVDASDISGVSDSISDWIDADDATHPAGAESDYYQGLNPPYNAKNAPLDDLSELLLVKGVTPAMYFGASATNVQESAFQRQKLGFGNAPGQDVQYAFGFTNIFTPFSSGKININTVGLDVLQLIPGMDTDSAQNLLKYRAGPDGADGTEDDLVSANPGQLLTAAGVNPQIIAQAGNFFTTRSTTFEVHVTAHIGDQSREFTGIIFRNGNNTQVVRFYW